MNNEIAFEKNRLAMNRIGLWLFFLSESFLFMGLLFVRFYLQGVSRPPQVNQPLGFAISIILLLSSLSAYRGEMHIANGMERAFRRNIITSIALGCLFLVGVGVEWRGAFHDFPPKTSYGTLFFTLTGFHAFHVLMGLVGLVTLVLP